MINLPIFRAKKIDSDEYVIGYLFKDTSGYLRITNGIKDNKHPLKLPFEWIINTATLAIHFPDMLDSQGNEIFASLQEDGKGGDIMQDDEYFGIAKYKDCQFVVEYEDCIDNIDNGNFEVIGIQQ